METFNEKPKKCEGCIFWEDNYTNDDGDYVEGWGCCNPCDCPLEKLPNGYECNIVL